MWSYDAWICIFYFSFISLTTIRLMGIVARGTYVSLTPKTLSITVQSNTSKPMSNLTPPPPPPLPFCPGSQPVKVINHHEYDWRLHRVYAQPLLKCDGCKSLFGRAVLLPYLSTGLVLLTPYITLTRRAWLGHCAAPDHGIAGIPAHSACP